MRFPAIPDSRRRYFLWALVAFGFLIRFALIFRDPSLLAMRPYLDDTFYVLSIARQMALGHIPSIEGIHLTNGFQPLIAFVYVPVYWLTSGDEWLFVRLSMVVQAAIFVWTIFALVDVVDELIPSDKRAGLLAAFLATISIGLFQHTMNGLETGLLTLMLLIALKYYLRLEELRKPGVALGTRKVAMFGLVLGLTVLARIDAAILVACFAAYDTVRGYWREAATYSVTALLVSLPWWIYSFVGFGSLMPISGTAEQTLGDPLGLKLTRSFATILDCMLGVWYAAFSASLEARIVIFIIFIATLLVITWRTKLWRDVRRASGVDALLPYIAYCAILTIYYTFFFGASHFTQRYLQPLRILWFVVVPVVLIVASRSEGFSRTRKKWSGAIVGLFVVSGCLFGINRYLTNFHASYTSDFYDMGLWARANPGLKIGMLQSGTASYIAPNITNLDGKVNRDALEARLHGKLGEYIQDQHFAYLADWNEFVNDIKGQAASAGAQYDSVMQIGSIEVLRAR